MYVDTPCVAGWHDGTLRFQQVWQWITHGATLQPGNKPLTKEGFEVALKDELAALRKQARVIPSEAEGPFKQ